MACGKDGGVFDILDVFFEFCFRLRHTREHEFRDGATTHFFLRHSNILHYFQKFYVGHFSISIQLQYLMFLIILIHYHRKNASKFQDAIFRQSWIIIGTTDLKLHRKSNFLLNNQNPPPLPPNNVDDHLHQPLFAFNFFQPTLDRGRGGWRLFGQSCELWRSRSFVHRCPNEFWPGL